MLSDNDFHNMDGWKLLSLRLIPFDVMGVSGEYYAINAQSGSFVGSVRVSKTMADSAYSVQTIVDYVVRKLEDQKQDMIELMQ